VSGQKRLKKAGRRKRSSGRRAIEQRLSFLCDHNIERRVREAVGQIPGYSVESLSFLGLARATDSGGVKTEANRRRAVIITRDHDYLDPIDFRICTHPGILLLSLYLPLDETVERLRAFLTSQYWKRCRHAIVQLRAEVALIQDRANGAIEEVRYFAN
jgi:predicted nuclease of predicted toxin-antitoxin system